MNDLSQYGYIETEIPYATGSGGADGTVVTTGSGGAAGTAKAGGAAKAAGAASAADAPAGALVPGRVIDQRRERYTVATERGEVPAELKGAFYHRALAGRGSDFPCVGDFVLLQRNDSGPSLIDRLLPRRTKFSRTDYSGHSDGYAKTILEQVVAANFDYVFIMTSMNRDFKTSRIARYLTQTRQSGGRPVVVLTKADLAEDCGAYLAAVEKAAPGVPAHAVSCRTGSGLEALGAYLTPGATAVFLGMSGVGKSSLLNILLGRDAMEVKAIRDDDSRGRHTTSHRQLFMLPSGAMVIDTPGMRELGLYCAGGGVGASSGGGVGASSGGGVGASSGGNVGASSGGNVGASSGGVDALFARCRFADCGHRSEPGCAVLAALSDGTLDPGQWESYLVQRREKKFVDDRIAAIRNKQAFQKSIAREIRCMKKQGGKNWKLYTPET